MKTDLAPTQPRRRIVVAAAVAVLALGATACQSDPGPKRVAQDIIEAERERGTLTESQAECMLEKLDENYSDSDLRAIDSGLDAGPGSSELAEAEEEIAAYEADLRECVAPDDT
ncbi:MAG: hypothetical protein AAGD33_14405 [Actinomycetota bacterium]